MNHKETEWIKCQLSNTKNTMRKVITHSLKEVVSELSIKYQMSKKQHPCSRITVCQHSP